MAQLPTHNVVIQTGIKNEGEEDEKKFFTTVGAAWHSNTEIGAVINIQLDFPVGVKELTLFPKKEKK